MTASVFFNSSIFIRSLFWLLPVVVATGVLQYFNLDLVHDVTSLHGSIVSGAFFITGFILSATIADYKESEKLPADFASTVTNMYHDVASIGQNYAIDTDQFRFALLKILRSLRTDVVEKTRETQAAVYELGPILASIETTGVPANFVVKLKQEQSQLVRSIMRIHYIQTIRFIPSAFLLARLVTFGVIGLLLVTRVEPVGGSILVTGLISFIFIYLLRLLEVIGMPFHPEGHTRDDVSMFQVNMAIVDLERKKVRVEV